MQNQVDPLARLADIQLPADPAFWPPAPGWWILFFIGSGLLYFAIKLLQKLKSKPLPTREFIQSINSIPTIQNAQTSDADRSAMEQISRLLRQYTIYRYGREQVASLSGNDWLRFLDSKTKTGKGFSDSAGIVLGNKMYQPCDNINIEGLKQFITHWARTTSRKKS